MWPQKLLCTILLTIGVCSALPDLTEELVFRDGTLAFSAKISMGGQVSAPTTSIPGAVLNDSGLFNTSSFATSTLVFPESISYCNTSSDSIDQNLMADMIQGEITESTILEVVPTNGGKLWSRVKKGGVQGTQTWLCNLNQWDMGFNVAQYTAVMTMLNQKCGDIGGWIYFSDWALWFGRDTTNEDGSFRPSCVGRPQQTGSLA